MTLTKDFNVAFYTRLVCISRYASLFREEDHPRNDAGEFREVTAAERKAAAGQKKPGKKPDAAQGALFQAKQQPGLFDTAPAVGSLGPVPTEKTGDQKIRDLFNERFNSYVSAKKPDTETVPGPAILAALKSHGIDQRHEPLAGQKSMFSLRDSILRELYRRGEIADPGTVERYSDSDERWITIGGGDGKGTHVKIKDGKIVSGPHELTGKSLDDLPERSESSESTPAPKPLPGWREFQLKREPAERPNPNKATQKPLGFKTERKTGAGAAKVHDLHIDPERFQYKLNTSNKKGVTGQFADIEFNPVFAGTIHVWHDTENGKTYVVNGHHRYELAERSGYAGNLQVHYLDVATAEEARATGALINIAGGNGTAVDAAKFMRDTNTPAEEMQRRGVSLKGQVAKDASTLSKLSNGIFRRLALGTYRIGRALAIAQHLPDHADQDRLDNWIDRYEENKGRELSDTTVDEMAREAAQASRQTHTTKGLFGEESEDRSLFVERAELKGSLRRDITSRLNKFRAVATDKAASTLEGANTINAAENKKTADRLAQFLDDFDRETSFRGPVSERLNQASQELANAPGKRKQITERLAADIRSLLETVPQADRSAEGQNVPDGDQAGSGGGVEDAGKQHKPAAGQKGFFARQFDRELERAVYGRARLTETFDREFYLAGLTTPRARYAERWQESEHPRATDGRFGDKAGEHQVANDDPKSRILSTLKHGRTHTATDLRALGFDAGPHIEDLVRSGQITAVGNKVGDPRYTLTAEQEQKIRETAQPPTYEPKPVTQPAGVVPSSPEPEQASLQPKKSQTTLSFTDPVDDTVENTRPDPIETESPREAARHQQQRTLDATYAFARASSVSNAGEDLLGSSRHRVNAWRGLEAAEADGTAAELVTRDNLLKNEPHNLMAGITPPNSIASLSMHLALQKFPTRPFDPDHHWYKRQSDETKATYRKNFVDAYRDIKAEAERIAREEIDPVAALKALSTTVSQHVNNIRARGMSYDPVANGLAKMFNNVRPATFGRDSRLHALTQVRDFVGKLGEKYGDVNSQTLDRAAEHAKDVMEGNSFNKTFGMKSTGKKSDFNPADLYVKTANRRGGREVPQTTEAGVKWLTDTVKLRGLQWGNYVTDDERRHHVTQLAGAFADMADVMGLRPEDISLGGKIGIAVGARGHSAVSAHYEPSNKVINLTRKEGVGTLAHEWGHALDHAIAGGGLTDRDGDYQSQQISDTQIEKDRNGRPKIENGKLVTKSFADDPMHVAYKNFRQAVRDSGFHARLRSTVQMMRQKKLMGDKKADYWLSQHEVFARVFERHVQHKLTADSRENTYLAGFVEKHAEGNASAEWLGLWPNAEESAKIAPAVDAIAAQYRKRIYGTEERQSYARNRMIAAFERAFYAAVG